MKQTARLRWPSFLPTRLAALACWLVSTGAGAAEASDASLPGRNARPVGYQLARNVVPEGAPRFEGLEGALGFVYVPVIRPRGWVCVALFPDGARVTYGAITRSDAAVPSPEEWLHNPSQRVAAERQHPLSGEALADPEALIWEAAFRGVEPSPDSEPPVLAARILLRGQAEALQAAMDRSKADSAEGWTGWRETRSVPHADDPPGQDGPN